MANKKGRPPLPGRAEGEQERWMTIKILDRHKEKLEEWQRRTGLSRSEIVRMLIDQSMTLVMIPGVSRDWENYKARATHRAARTPKQAR